jgi:hypothetical protein
MSDAIGPVFVIFAIITTATHNLAWGIFGTIAVILTITIYSMEKEKLKGGE